MAVDRKMHKKFAVHVHFATSVIMIGGSNQSKKYLKITVDTIKSSGRIQIVAAHHFTGGLLLTSIASKGKNHVLKYTTVLKRY
ncbi:MAG: hypothetical protein ABI656_09510 [bacterium]